MGRKLFNPAYFNDIGLDNIVPVQLGGTGASSAEVASLTLNFVSKSMVGAANGVAALDANGLVPVTQIPDVVYDVIEVESYAALPVPGKAGKIYIAQDTGLLYRWSNNAYVQLNASVGVSSVADRLSTARKINGTSFDGSVDITTASWGAARTITIGVTGKTVDGGSNVSWSLAEIGAASASHTHTLADITDFALSAPTAGQFFRYNGTNWVNTTLTASDIPALDASKITTGVISPTILAGTYAISITGNAATATKLAAPVMINGVSFDGSASITINAVDATPRIAESEKGVPNGVATLDSSGLVPSTQLPSYVDDVLEYDTVSLFPMIGERGKIYVALDTNLIYRWTGSTYININSSVGSADTATRLATARKINGTSFDGSADITTASWGAARTITIGVTGKTVDGSSNVSWSLVEIGAAATSHTHTLANITDFVVSSPAAGQFFRYNGTNWVNTTLTSSDIPALDASKITTGTLATGLLSGTYPISVSGNAATASKLLAPVSINGTNFDGSANITTASWGSARTITIGVTGKTVDGSSNVSWSLAEIGAAAASHTHTLANITDFVITAPAAGQFFRYNGTNWVNTTLSSSDIPALDASKITTGSIADARLSNTFIEKMTVLNFFASI